MKRRLFNLMLLCAVLAASSVLIVPAESAAQGRGRGRYERDQRRYRERYSRQDVSAIISSVEDSSNRFRKDLDRDLDRSRLDGTKREDRINDEVRRFENELNRLRKEFDSRDDWWESRAHVQRAVDSSRPVATRMRNNRFSPEVENQWRNLLRDINRLALAYDLPYVR